MYQDTLISRNAGRGATLLFGAGVALAASALFGIAEPAVAQGNDADDAMDEIIVTTARRREESLMDVPLSISVIGGVDLERVGAVDIIEIANIFRARIVDMGPGAIVTEVTGTEDKVNAFIDMMRPFGISELVRTGRIAMVRSGADDDDADEDGPHLHESSIRKYVNS